MKSAAPSTSRSISPGRAKHLERNRIASNKCRERKKREHKKIERRFTDETQKKDTLLAQLNCLREEVWDLKSRIFQHAGCHDQRINRQLGIMTQTVHGPSNPDVHNSSPSASSSRSFSTGTWSGESVSDGANTVESVAYNNNNDWTVLPDIAIGFTTHEPNGYEPNGFLTDSIFDNFIDAENGFT
ncbi:hypothetical protein N7489_003579 [Penicillium chrysogenum]|jgi:hypothetical protein|uniref:uncharacterized protein n=1 Tax=Penicillium chrysogenum TaxID=5076 RepID=UPI0024DF2A00|nr:uncharacterized protein N7489_003579 [Penicillium chrysogenum]KAJ5253169.1 hypothetical protein N7489_003579 [Penicillium chrysogenum]KAJ6137003.1 hypothetical protein N7497_012255 [Penicillium chrysogenum]